jgi:hypothetical protein
MHEKGMEIWDLWYPNAAAQGLPFCRSRLDPTDELLVHAAPDVLRVEVRDDAGSLIASGDQLQLTGEYYPMTRLRRDGARIVRQDGWPAKRDIGRVVLLPGGEAGRLLAWENAPDGSEWRWSIEFYNRR